MAPAADPTYPLYPVANIITAFLLLLVLTTSFARQSWNLGVTFLCFWLFVENLTSGVNAILWADNYDIKLYVYCDIVTRLQVITSIVKPACTLIITRRLYVIASLKSVTTPSAAEKRWNLIIDWTLGLGLPVLVAGPFYYLVEGSRFLIAEGQGCGNAITLSGATVLLILIWPLVLPLVSVLLYCPKIFWVFYRQRQDTSRFLSSHRSISRQSYFRILALASIDAILTLPFGITSLVLNVQTWLDGGDPLPFYQGFGVIHSDWEPIAYSYASEVEDGTATLAQIYFSYWTSPVLALAVFALFGMTAEARATYWRLLRAAAARLGLKLGHPEQDVAGIESIAFGERPHEITLDMEQGSRLSFVASGLVSRDNLDSNMPVKSVDSCKDLASPDKHSVPDAPV